MRTIKIGNHLIGPDQPVYVIAEGGANHEGDIEAAERMIVEAAQGGAQCIKFQTYKADKLVTRTAPKYWYDPGQRAANQHEMFAQLDGFDQPEWQRLIAKADEMGITFMSSAWDEDSVDMLDALGMPAFKIGSADITCLPLIKHTARTGKPIILSTGASTLGEIEAAVNVIRDEGNKDIVLLHCVLSYPTENKDANLNMMAWLQQVFPDIPIGYSDHTIADPAMTVPLAAAAMGARVIEKHFTLDKSLPGNDHYLSMDAKDLARWNASLEIIYQAQGTDGYRNIIEAEQTSRIMARRSLVSRVDIPEGTVITREMLTYKRPGTGISPADIDIVVGRHARVAIPEDQTLTWDMV